MEGIVQAWGRILSGYTPLLSIEITRECPLSCAGCYAYGDQHLGGEVTLRQVSDFKGQALVDGVLGLVRKHKPVHVSLVGGEPLIRHRELDELLPKLADLGIHTQLVTSAVRRIPEHWASIPNLQICVSVDGLQPEHDARRKPATYARILQNMEGHQISIHCTVTRQQVSRAGYLETFLQFWSSRQTTKRIWISLYTPQQGEVSGERLTPEDRQSVVNDLFALRSKYPKLDMRREIIEFYAGPYESPQECIFARVTTCVSADFKSAITPCQFGGTPDCKNCGCMASAGMAAIGRYRLPVGIQIGKLFEASVRTGSIVRRIRKVLPWNGQP